MVVGQEVVDVGHVLAGKLLHHQRAVGREEEPPVAALPVRGAPRQRHLFWGTHSDVELQGGPKAQKTPQGVSPHLIVLVVDAEALAEVAEDLGTIFLELEVAGEVLPGGVGETVRYWGSPPGPSPGPPLTG